MFEENFQRVWVYLSASPLLGLTMTLIAYSLAYRLYQFSRENPCFNPVLSSILILIIFLKITKTSYDVYFEGGQFVQFLLGPATVALAIPLYQQVSKLKKLWIPVAIALFGGVVTGAMSSVFLSRLLGATVQTQLSLAPKSVTAAVAMGISEQIGGIPSLTAVLVVITGILGSVVGNRLLDLLRIEDQSVRGIAMGLTAHGIGTARAFQLNSEMGAFSGLAMALSAFITAVLLPWLLTWDGVQA